MMLSEGKREKTTYYISPFICKISVCQRMVRGGVGLLMGIEFLFGMIQMFATR